MTGRDPKRSFASRPGDEESWIKTPDLPTPAPPKADTFTARLTIDVTPELRGGVTVADMLRDLLAREFPESTGDAP